MSGVLRAAGVASALVAAVNAHGTVQGFIHDGEWITGYNPSFQYDNPEPKTPGWRIPKDLGNGFIAPDAFDTSDVICHVGKAS
jgi:lytic cellulose monooxygenase (C1-hydroxylating)